MGLRLARVERERAPVARLGFGQVALVLVPQSFQIQGERVWQSKIPFLKDASELEACRRKTWCP